METAEKHLPQGHPSMSPVYPDWITGGERPHRFYAHLR